MENLFTHAREWLADHLTVKAVSICGIALLILAFWCGGHYSNWLSQDNGLELVRADATPTADKASGDDHSADEQNGGSVTVHVTGAVNAPGVYTLPSGKRIDDAVRAAGVRTEADLDLLNLAQKLVDGQKIVVPAEGESPAASVSSSGAPAADGSGPQVNLNTATKEELMTLPSIGEVRAEAIIKWREENGSFQSPDDLEKVSGIGKKTFADLESRITV